MLECLARVFLVQWQIKHLCSNPKDRNIEPQYLGSAVSWGGAGEGESSRDE